MEPHHDLVTAHRRAASWRSLHAEHQPGRVALQTWLRHARSRKLSSSKEVAFAHEVPRAVVHERPSSQSLFERRLGEIRAELKDTRARLSALESLLSPPDATREPFWSWLAAHPTDEERYAGMQVAFHPTRGIIAASHSLEELLDRLGDDPDGSAASLDVVPARGSSS